MSRSIIGVTVGTAMSPASMERKLKPVKTVNGIAPDENGNVELVGGVGEDGASAYEIAVKNGFEGTEEEWLESLNGKDGETPEFERPNGAPYTLIKMGGEIVTAIQDGYSPQKGLDYWTEEEKAEMVADVIAQLPIYNGEVV